MSIETAKPLETYEGLKTQFFAMKNLLISMEKELSIYKKMTYDLMRLKELEQELESQKEMNSFLAREIELMVNK
jgi:hypothetical protein